MPPAQQQLQIVLQEEMTYALPVPLSLLSVQVPILSACPQLSSTAHQLLSYSQGHMYCSRLK